MIHNFKVVGYGCRHFILRWMGLQRQSLSLWVLCPIRGGLFFSSFFCEAIFFFWSLEVWVLWAQTLGCESCLCLPGTVRALREARWWEPLRFFSPRALAAPCPPLYWPGTQPGSHACTWPCCCRTAVSGVAAMTGGDCTCLCVCTEYGETGDAQISETRGFSCNFFSMSEVVMFANGLKHYQF